jgi:fructose-1,6-bisphosphatase II
VNDIETGLLAAMRSAARAVVPLLGCGDADAVDAAAVSALRAGLDLLPVDGLVVVGEGEKDAAPRLSVGERFGRGGVPIDIAVDPIDGTRLAASGLPGAMVLIAAAPRGALAEIGGAHYLDKLVTRVDDPRFAIDGSVQHALGILASALGRPVVDLRVAVQDRPRNAAVADAVLATGAHLDAFTHGDIERSLRVLLPSGGLDALIGIGGAPEGVITALAAGLTGGGMRARFAPQSDAEAGRVGSDGLAAWPSATPGAFRGWVGVASVSGVDLGSIVLPPVAGDGTVAVWSIGSL